jgi:hypothetical protein
LLDRKVGDLEVERDQRNWYAYFPSIITIVRSTSRPLGVIKKDGMPPPTSFNVRRGSDPQRLGLVSCFVRIFFYSLTFLADLLPSSGSRPCREEVPEDALFIICLTFITFLPKAAPCSSHALHFPEAVGVDTSFGVA